MLCGENLGFGEGRIKILFLASPPCVSTGPVFVLDPHIWILRVKTHELWYFHPTATDLRSSCVTYKCGSVNMLRALYNGNVCTHIRTESGCLWMFSSGETICKLTENDLNVLKSKILILWSVQIQHSYPPTRRFPSRCTAALILFSREPCWTYTVNMTSNPSEKWRQKKNILDTTPQIAYKFRTVFA